MVGAEPPKVLRDRAAAELGLTVSQEILEGGSSARVYRARTGEGEDVVLKVLGAGAQAVVDGHDLDSFRAKARQIAHIEQRAASLGARYLPITRSIDAGTWAAHLTPYYPSQDLAAPLRDGRGVGAFFEQLTLVIEELATHGYGRASVPAPPAWLDEVVIDRFTRRLMLLEQALPQAVCPDVITVDGQTCIAPRILLPRLRARAAHPLMRMRPPRLGLGAHGDANTRNILMSPAGDDFRLIDPRGSSAPWDPVYDLAKILFSLTIWDLALRDGVKVRRNPSRQITHYDVALRSPAPPDYARAIDGFLPFLSTLPALSELLADDPGWVGRLVLTHDLHVLSEASCRLSDTKPRRGSDGRASTPEELALGHYLLGTRLLNDLAEQLQRPDGLAGLDLHRHFALLPR